MLLGVDCIIRRRTALICSKSDGCTFLLVGNGFLVDIPLARVVHRTGKEGFTAVMSDSTVGLDFEAGDSCGSSVRVSKKKCGTLTRGTLITLKLCRRTSKDTAAVVRVRDPLRALAERSRRIVTTDADLPIVDLAKSTVTRTDTLSGHLEAANASWGVVEPLEPGRVGCGESEPWYQQGKLHGE